MRFITLALITMATASMAQSPPPDFGKNLPAYQITPWAKIDPTFRPMPSPKDWRKLPIYQILTDRFDNADTTNDNIRGWLGPGDWRKAQGGDWKGITSRLDYIKSLGFHAIWISPVHRNITFDSTYSISLSK